MVLEEFKLVTNILVFTKVVINYCPGKIFLNDLVSYSFLVGIGNKGKFQLIRL